MAIPAGVRNLMQSDLIRRNFLQIQEEIAPYSINIIAVTKYFDESAIEAAYEAGLRDFAESRAVEAVEKIGNLSEELKSNSKFHFIGHLQTNKVKKVVGAFDLIHSVDSYKLASAISEEALKVGKVQDILLQLNNAEEVQKFGYSKSQLFEDFPKILALKGVKVKGLMNMAPLGAEEDLLENLFLDVINTRDELEKQFDCNLKDISMGMSQDYKIAARCGSTMLRIGRKLFK